jgi:hypothetical protein
VSPPRVEADPFPDIPGTNVHEQLPLHAGHVERALLAAAIVGDPCALEAVRCLDPDAWTEAARRSIADKIRRRRHPMDVARLWSLAQSPSAQRELTEVLVSHSSVPVELLVEEVRACADRRALHVIGMAFCNLSRSAPLAEIRAVLARLR